MKITVEVTEVELEEMNCNASDLKTIICNDLDDFYSEYYVEVIEMTNQEYEAASIAAAGCYERFEGEHKLQQWDEHIATLEAALAKAHEARREIVNQYNLNKCDHNWHNVPHTPTLVCKTCGERK